MFNVLLKQINKSTSYIHIPTYTSNSNNIIRSTIYNNIFLNSSQQSQPIQQQCYYSKIKEKQVAKKKQKILKEKKRDRIELIENTDIKSLPKSDLVYGNKQSDLVKLNLLVGGKLSKKLKESTRANWHSRHLNNQKTTTTGSHGSGKLINPITNQIIDINKAPLSSTLKIKKQIEQIEYRDKGIKPKYESKNKEFQNVEFDSKILDNIKTKQLGMLRIQKQKQGTTKLESVRKEVTKDIERYFGSKLKLIASAKSVHSFLPESLPEVAFIGRSNVGKSSLINALTQRGLAKTSSKPGQTQSINWYELGSTLFLVDLPGYGFAFAKEQKLEQWSEITHHYLTQRKSIQCVFILIDSRHGLKDSDRELLLELDKCKIVTHVILTKADLIFQNDLAKRIQLTNDEIKTYHHSKLPVLSISSKNYSGISDLSKLIKVMKLKIKPVKLNPNQRSKTILSPHQFELKKLKLAEKKKENLKNLILNKSK